MQVNKSPEWLPSGWVVQVKQRPTGRQDKYYIDPIRGHKFRSKNEVLRYLAKNEVLRYLGKGDIVYQRRSKAIVQCTPPETASSKRSSWSKAISVARDESVGKSPPWLPSGWIVEVRERRSGLKDKYYIDPIHGYKFRSKREVLQYIGKGDIVYHRRSGGSKAMVQCTPAETASLKRSSGSNPLSVAAGVSVEMSPPWLPSGWVVEVKERRSGLRDKYYIEPVFGYKFRSKVEVRRYLENGELPRGVGRKRVLNDADQEIQLFDVDKVQRQGCSSTRRCLFAGQSSKKCKSSHVQTLDKNGVGCCNGSGLAIIPFETENSPNMQENTIHKGARYVVPLSVVSPQNQRVQNSSKEHGKSKSKFGQQKFESRKALSLPCRSSRRLSGLEPEFTPEMGLKNNQTVPMEARIGVVTGKSHLSFGIEDQPSAPAFGIGDQPSEPFGKEQGDQVTWIEHIEDQPNEPAEREIGDEVAKKEHIEDQPNEPTGRELGDQVAQKEHIEDQPNEPSGREHGEQVSQKEHIEDQLYEPSGRKLDDAQKECIEDLPNELAGKELGDQVPQKEHIEDQPNEPAGREIDDQDAQKERIEDQPNEPTGRELGDQVAKEEQMKKLKEYQIKFREPLLDPCVSFAFKTLTGAIEGQPNEPAGRDLSDQVAKEQQMKKLEEYQIKFREPLLDPCVSFAFKTLTGAIEDQPNEPTERELGDQVAKEEQMKKLEEYQNKFREPLLDPCVSFAFKTLTGAIAIDNIFMESQLGEHVSPGSIRMKDEFRFPEINTKADFVAK